VDIPFAFNNTDKVPTEVGTDAAALKPIMEVVCDSFVAFARTGNPNVKGHPNWPAFDDKTQAIMVIDTKSQLMDAKRHTELAALRKVEAV